MIVFTCRWHFSHLLWFKVLWQIKCCDSLVSKCMKTRRSKVREWNLSLLSGGGKNVGEGVECKGELVSTFFCRTMARGFEPIFLLHLRFKGLANRHLPDGSAFKEKSILKSNCRRCNFPCKKVEFGFTPGKPVESISYWLRHYVKMFIKYAESMYYVSM